MILILAIILFIIFLIYSIKPIKSEEYALEGLKLSWLNKVGIEGIVTKWIVTLKDSSGSVIHTYENSDAGNLKDFTDVTMNIVDKKEFDEKIIGDNTLELYYNDIKPDTKLYTKTVTFTRDDFGMALDTSNLEEIDIPPPTAQPTASSSSRGIRYVWFGYENKTDYLNIAEIEVYSGGKNIVKDIDDSKVTVNSEYGDGTRFRKNELFDGNYGNMYHSAGKPNDWIKIDLGKKYSVIDKVMVYNRSDCCQGRWEGAVLKLLDSDGNVIKEESISPDDRNKKQKTFTFGNTVATPPTELSEPRGA